MQYRTKREDALDNDLEVSINCFGVDFQGNFFKRSLKIYLSSHKEIPSILDRWNFQGGLYRMIEGSFAPIHHYKLDKISLKGNF